MTARLASADHFDTHVSNLRENFVISDIGGIPSRLINKSIS